MSRSIVITCPSCHTDIPLAGDSTSTKQFSEWHARLLLSAERARQGEIKGIVVLFDGLAMNIFKLTPDGRVEIDHQ